MHSAFSTNSLAPWHLASPPSSWPSRPSQQNSVEGSSVQPWSLRWQQRPWSCSCWPRVSDFIQTPRHAKCNAMQAMLRRCGCVAAWIIVESDRGLVRACVQAPTPRSATRAAGPSRGGATTASTASPSASPRATPAGSARPGPACALMSVSMVSSPVAADSIHRLAHRYVVVLRLKQPSRQCRASDSGGVMADGALLLSCAHANSRFRVDE